MIHDIIERNTMLSYLYHIFLIKSVTLWNTCTSYYTSVKQTLFHTYSDAKHYLNNHHAIWVFLPGYTLPLPRYCISNLPTSSWKYDQSTNQLYYAKDTKIGYNPTSYSFSWLSVKLVVTQGTHEYDMDPFLESFRVHTDIHPPTLNMVYMAWCAKHSLWFPKNNITMHVIDHLGNDMILNPLIHNDSITIQCGKLHTSIPSGVLPYDEGYPMIRPNLSSNRL